MEFVQYSLIFRILQSGYEEDAVCAKRLKLSHGKKWVTKTTAYSNSLFFLSDSTINYKDSTSNLMASDLVATPCRER